MKNNIKNIFLTLVSACLIAGGLVSVGIAANEKTESGIMETHKQNSQASAEKENYAPDEIEINGSVFKKVNMGDMHCFGCGCPYSNC